ncbi:MAG: hypothetical protein GY845_35445 [Planctomycetes bacterium]|nr:hypothetical protein [Planctomycetota bacterium]
MPKQNQTEKKRPKSMYRTLKKLAAASHRQGWRFKLMQRMAGVFHVPGQEKATDFIDSMDAVVALMKKSKQACVQEKMDMSKWRSTMGCTVEMTDLLQEMIELTYGSADFLTKEETALPKETEITNEVTNVEIS